MHYSTLHGEYKVTKRVVEHEIKLEESVKFILVVLTLRVSLNAFKPVFDVREAFAKSKQRGVEVLK